MCDQSQITFFSLRFFETASTWYGYVLHKQTCTRRSKSSAYTHQEQANKSPSHDSDAFRRLCVAWRIGAQKEKSSKFCHSLQRFEPPTTNPAVSHIPTDLYALVNHKLSKPCRPLPMGVPTNVLGTPWVHPRTLFHSMNPTLTEVSVPSSCATPSTLEPVLPSTKASPMFSIATKTRIKWKRLTTLYVPGLL